jgi:1-acyl-sn-glycerol-3-phosphate acyltransferase
VLRDAFALVRAGLRLPAVAVWTLACYLPLEPLNLVLRPWPLRRAAVQAWFLSVWGRVLTRLLGARVERRGPLPEPPFLLVANHLSYLDIPLLAETGGRFVAKAEIRGWPVAGRVCAAAGVIFVDRSTKRDLLRVGRVLEEAMSEARGVILFPEGTTGRGDAMLPFRPGLLAEAARSRRPVHHAVISYRTGSSAPPADEVVVWWGDQDLWPHLRRLLLQPPFHARVEYGREPVEDEDRKRLAERLRQAMEKRFVPSGGDPAEAVRPAGRQTPEQEAQV